MYAVRRNVDERLRELQRAALGGHPQDQEDYFRAAVRGGDCDLVGEALFAMGPEQALRVLTPPPMFKGPRRHELRAEANAERDTQAICLGHHLVQLGYLPDIPVRTYSSPGPYGTGGFTEHMQSTKPKWIPLPASVRGQARRKRFLATYGFGYTRAWGNEEGGDRQSPTFYFKLEPLGKHYGAEQYVRDLGMDEGARRIAPSVRFLARWNRSNVVNRPWASGQRLDVAGGTDMYWLQNNIYAYSRSDPARGPDQYEDSNESWDTFLRGSRTGYIPGDPIPPRAPAWSPQQVEAWLRDPERNDALRALFYADLWLAGLLVPGESVGYDPITGGPAVQSNPWRLNADPRLRQAERRAAIEQSVEALAELYVERMRAGDLHPADLWLAARIPPYNTCLAEVHDAAELAFGEEIEVANVTGGAVGSHSIYVYDLVSEVFGRDIRREVRPIPRERLLRRLAALSWLLRRTHAEVSRLVSGERIAVGLRPEVGTPFRATSAIEHRIRALERRRSVTVRHPAVLDYSRAVHEGAKAITALTLRLPVHDRMPVTLLLMGDLQRHLLRSPQ